MRILLVLLFLVTAGCASPYSDLINAPDGCTTKMRVSGSTQSMYPFYKGGESIKVEKVPFDNIKIGDIVIYQNYRNYMDDLIIHRVIWRDSESLICKGDNNNFVDPYPIYKDNYVGVVVQW